MEKVFVFHNGFLFAERWGHHWYIADDAIRQGMIAKAGWPSTTEGRKPEGTRIDR